MGKLFLVPTPIGNLGDMTFRAVEVLKQVDCILAEDTRTSAKLLQHYQIHTPMQSYHQHNEHRITETLVKRLLAGEDFALITDAGTPGISDPGFLLARACVRAEIPVECLPGATAFVPALVSSGFPCDRFSFEGFLSEKKGKHTRLSFLASEERTMIFYVSPHKLVKNLEDFVSYFGENRRASLCRELTKIYEEVRRGTLSELLEHYQKVTIKGEIVLVIAGCKNEKENDPISEENN